MSPLDEMLEHYNNLKRSPTQRLEKVLVSVQFMNKIEKHLEETVPYRSRDLWSRVEFYGVPVVLDLAIEDFEFVFEDRFKK